MISDVGEDALALLNAPSSVPVGRAEIWPDRGNTFKDACPSMFDGWQAHEKIFRCRCVINPIQCSLKQLLFAPGECKLRLMAVVKQPCRH